MFRVHLDICEAREELTLDLNELAGASKDARREWPDIAMDALEELDNETLDIRETYGCIYSSHVIPHAKITKT